MIKLLNILKEILNYAKDLDPKFLNGVKFYHGTVNFEIKNASDLDPLFRQKDAYQQRQKNLIAQKHSGSSSSGIGIYFGRHSNEQGTEDAMQYMQKDANLAPNSRGFMYEMTLKPGSKVVTTSSGFALLTQSTYEELLKQGVDAISQHEQGGGLNLINPEAVASWKEIDSWKKPFDVYLFKYDEKQATDIRVEEKRFWDFVEFNKYVTDHLGKVSTYGNEGTIQSEDPNSLFSIMVKRPEL
jgi:hypothetical protein